MKNGYLHSANMKPKRAIKTAVGSRRPREWVTVCVITERNSNAETCTRVTRAMLLWLPESPVVLNSEASEYFWRLTCRITMLEGKNEHKYAQKAAFQWTRSLMPLMEQTGGTECWGRGTGGRRLSPPAPSCAAGSHPGTLSGILSREMTDPFSCQAYFQPNQCQGHSSRNPSFLVSHQRSHESEFWHYLLRKNPSVANTEILWEHREGETANHSSTLSERCNFKGKILGVKTLWKDKLIQVNPREPKRSVAATAAPSREANTGQDHRLRNNTHRWHLWFISWVSS